MDSLYLEQPVWLRALKPVNQSVGFKSKQSSTTHNIVYNYLLLILIWDFEGKGKTWVGGGGGGGDNHKIYHRHERKMKLLTWRKSSKPNSQNIPHIITILSSIVCMYYSSTWTLLKLRRWCCFTSLYLPCVFKDNKLYWVNQTMCVCTRSGVGVGGGIVLHLRWPYPIPVCTFKGQT